MEKSNSFKRVLAGTLALLTVASSIPTEAGSVIGNFFNTAIVADAASGSIPETTSSNYIAISKINVTGTTGTATVKVGANDAVTANVTATPDANNSNIVTYQFQATDAFAGSGNNVYAVVDGCTVINIATAEKESYNAVKNSNDIITVKVNLFTSLVANHVSNYTYDGNYHTVKIGKNYQDEAGIDSGDTGAENNVEVSYIDATGKYIVLTEEELTNADLFTVTGDGSQTEVKRDKNAVNGTVLPYTVTFTGKEGSKFEGLSVDTKFQINPKPIDNDVDIVYENANDVSKKGKVTYTLGTKGDKTCPIAASAIASGTDNADIAADMTFIKSVKSSNAANAVDVSYDVKYAAVDGALTDANDDGIAESAMNVGKYKATLSFGGNYTGSKDVEFEIVARDITDAILDGVDQKASVVYDRKNDLPITIKEGSNDGLYGVDKKNPYSLTLTTYKATVGTDGKPKLGEDEKWQRSTVATEDVSAAGYYVTVVKATGNFTGEQAIQWQRNAYDLAKDSDHRITIAANAVVNQTTGKVAPAIVVTDNAETDPSVQSGVKLVENTDYTVLYSTEKNGTFVATVPDSGEFYVKVTGKGNYAGETKAQKVEVTTSKYTPGDAILTTKTSTGAEQVKYQYGDTVGVTVSGVPAALASTQEVRYLPVDLDKNGAPVKNSETGNYQNNGVDVELTFANTVDKDNLVAREKTTGSTFEDKGYIAVVFINRNDLDNKNYNPLFEPDKVAVSKGFTVSKRTVSQDSVVAVEFKNPLLQYKASEYTLDELRNNISKITVDGKDFYTAPTDGTVPTNYNFALKAIDNVKYKDVNDYSIKIDFSNNGDNANYTGEYTTDVNTQKFSIVATAINPQDFTVKYNGTGDPMHIAIKLKDKDGNEIANPVYSTADIDFANGQTIAYYYLETSAKYTTNEIEAAVASTGKYDQVDENEEIISRDYQVVGNKQTAPGEYEFTIKGLTNTKGSLTVKWNITGNKFGKDDKAYFTATATPTTFNYNGQPQSPAFTVSRAADADPENKSALTLVEGTDYAVEYYTGKNEDGTELTGKLDGAPVNVGTYYAKIVGIGTYYGANTGEDANRIAPIQFTIAPSADLSITITPKKDADFTYNGETIMSRLTDLFDFAVDGKALDTDEVDVIYHLTKDGKATETEKSVGNYKISVTISNENYRPKTSQETEFTITPKEITLKNIKAGTKAAVYGAPVAQINDSITFDYEGVLDADKDKVSVDDFKDYIKVSDNYHSGSPAGEYSLVYNKDYTPTGDVAKNYKAKEFAATEKITIAKKDLADAKDKVTLVIVHSSFTNEDHATAGDAELAANQIVYNGEPYEVYIQKNDDGLLTMADLDFIDTSKALHVGEYTLTATASATGNYKGNTEIPLEWKLLVRPVTENVDVDLYHNGTKMTEANNLVQGVIDHGATFGPNGDYQVKTNIEFYDVEKKQDGTYENKPNGKLASEGANDYTVYYTKLGADGKPDESTRTTGYPTTSGTYRATVELSSDFVLETVKTTGKKAEIGYVDFVVKGELLDATITDNNTGMNFKRVYNDNLTPSFTINIKDTAENKDKMDNELVTANVDLTKMFKYEEVERGTEGAVTINEKSYKLTTTPYDGTAGYYNLSNAIYTNNGNFDVTFDADDVKDITKDSYGNLVYEVKQSQNYSILFNGTTNVYELKGSSVSADIKVIDNYTQKELALNTDYTIKGTKTSTKAGTFTLFVEGKGNYAGYKTADWKVVKAGESTDVDAKFYAGNTVSFKDKVEFNFLVDIADSAYVDGSYVVFTYNHYGDTMTVTKPITKSDMNGNHYRVRLPLTASEMAIDIKAELYLANSSEPIDTKTRSIKDYAEAAIKANLDGSDVLRAMLNYGGYTQVALGNNTSLLANSGVGIKEDVSSVQPKSVTTFVRPTPFEGTFDTAVAGIPQTVKVKFTPKVTYRGTSVMTTSDVYVRHYFNVDSSMTDAEIKATRVKYGDTTYSLDELKHGNNYYLNVKTELVYNLDRDTVPVIVYGFPGTVSNTESYLTAAGVTIKAGATTFNVNSPVTDAIEAKDEYKYNTYGSRYNIVITNYNVVDYCESISNNAGQSENNKNMVKSLFKYYEAAKAYVASRTAN